jgi:hypothetical protein
MEVSVITAVIGMNSDATCGFRKKKKEGVMWLRIVYVDLGRGG